MKPYIDYDRWLHKTLKDPKIAEAYLNEALAENDPTLFLSACYQVARACGAQVIADRAKVHRVSLAKMLSTRGNPEWKSLVGVLAASGLRLRVEAVSALRP